MAIVDPYAGILRRDPTGADFSAAPNPYAAAIDAATPVPYTDAERTAAITDPTSQFGRGLRSSLRTLGAAAPAIAGAGANLVSQGAGDGLLTTAAGMMKQAEESGPRISSLRDVHSANDVGDYAGGFVGSALPNVALALAGGGLGGAAVKGLTRKIGLDAVEGLAEKVTAARAAAVATPESVAAQGAEAATRAAQADAGEAVTAQAAKAVGQAQPSAAALKAGELAGTTAGMYPSTVASSVAGAPDANGKMVGGLLGASPGDTAKILLGDLGSAAVGSLPEVRLLGKIAGPAATDAIAATTQSFMSRMAKEGVSQAGWNAAGGFAQTAAQFATHKWVNDNVDMLSPTAYHAYLDSAFGGALLGAGMGGAVEAGHALPGAIKDTYGALHAQVRDALSAAADRSRAAYAAGRPAVDSVLGGAANTVSGVTQAATDALKSKFGGGKDGPAPGEAMAPDPNDGTPPTGGGGAADFASNLGSVAGTAAGTVHAHAVNLFQQLHGKLTTDEGRASVTNAFADALTGLGDKFGTDPIGAGMTALHKSYSQAYSDATTPAAQADIAKAYGDTLTTLHDQAEPPSAKSSFDDNLNRMQESEKLDDSADDVMAQINAGFDAHNNARADPTMPIQQRFVGGASPLQNAIVGASSPDSPIRAIGARFGAAAEKLFKGEELNPYDHHVLTEAHAADPSFANYVEVMASKQSSLFKGSQKVTDAMNSERAAGQAEAAAARADGAGAQEDGALQQAGVQKAAAANAEADASATDYNGNDFIPGVFEHGPEDANTHPADALLSARQSLIEARSRADAATTPADKASATADATAAEAKYARADDALHTHILGGDSATFTENFKARKEFEDKLASPATVLLDQPKILPNGDPRRQLLELGTLIKREQVRDPTLSAKSALKQGLANAQIADIGIDSKTLTAGKILDRTGKTITQLTPNDVKELRGAIEAHKASGKIASKPVNETRGIPKTVPKDGKPVAQLNDEANNTQRTDFSPRQEYPTVGDPRGRVSVKEEGRNASDSFDQMAQSGESADLHQRIPRVSPMTADVNGRGSIAPSQGVVSGVQVSRPLYDRVTKMHRDVAQMKELQRSRIESNQKARHADLIRDVPDATDFALLRHKAGVDIGERALAARQGSADHPAIAPMTDRAHAAQLKKLHDMSSGESERYIKLAESGALDEKLGKVARVQELKQDTNAPVSSDQRTAATASIRALGSKLLDNKYASNKDIALKIHDIAKRVMANADAKIAERRNAHTDAVAAHVTKAKEAGKPVSLAAKDLVALRRAKTEVGPTTPVSEAETELFTKTRDAVDLLPENHLFRRAFESAMPDGADAPTVARGNEDAAGEITKTATAVEPRKPETATQTKQRRAIEATARAAYADELTMRAAIARVRSMHPDAGPDKLISALTSREATAAMSHDGKTTPMTDAARAEYDARVTRMVNTGEKRAADVRAATAGKVRESTVESPSQQRHPPMLGARESDRALTKAELATTKAVTEAAKSQAAGEHLDTTAAPKEAAAKLKAAMKVAADARVKNRADAAERKTASEVKRLDDKSIADQLKEATGDKGPHDHKKEERTLNDMLAKMGIKEKITVARMPDEVAKKSGGDYHPGTNEIRINPNLKGAERIQVLAHELGHHVIRSELAKAMGVPMSEIADFTQADVFHAMKAANPELHAAVSADYEKWYAEYSGGTENKSNRYIDVLASKKGFARAQGMRARNMDNKTTLGENNIHGDGNVYLHSFEEYMADQVSRALTHNETSPAAKFFKGIADKLKMAYDGLFKGKGGDKYAAAPSVEKWVQSLFDRTTNDVRAATGEGVTAEMAKNDQIAGLHAKAAVDAVGGEPPGPKDPGVAPTAPELPPDGIKTLSDFVKNRLPPDARAILDQVLSRGRSIQQLEKIYANDPVALHAMRSPENGIQTRIVYAALAREAGLFKGGPNMASVLSSVTDKLFAIAHLASKTDMAERIFSDISSGRIDNLLKAGKEYDIRTQEVKDRGPMQAVLNSATKIAETAAKPLHTVFSSSVNRMRATSVPAIMGIAAKLQRHTGDAGEDPGFVPAVTHVTDRFMRSAGNVFNGLSDVNTMHVLKALQSQDMTPHFNPVVAKAVDDARALFNRFKEYSDAAGHKMGAIENYFPVMMDVHNQHGEDTLATLLKGNPAFEQPIREFFSKPNAKTGKNEPSKKPLDELIQNMVDGAKRNPDPSESVGPDNFRGQSQRSMQFIYEHGTPEEKATFATLQSKNLSEILSRHILPMVRKVESVRRFGVDDAKLKGMMADAKKQGATSAQIAHAQAAVDAARGHIAIDGSPTIKAIFGKGASDALNRPGVRKVISGVQTYENVRLLPLSLLSSVVDPMGIAVRTGGDFKTAWDGFKFGMKTLASKASREEALNMLRMLGTADDFNQHDIINSNFGGSKGPSTSAINDLYFKANGLAGWTRATRFMALQAAHGFLVKHAALDTPTSARYLDELGVRKGDITKDPATGRTKVMTDAERAAATPDARAADDRVRNALLRFVDEAALRPTSQQAPNWFADPYMGLVTQYKHFAYSIQDQIGHRIVTEVKHGNPSVLIPAMGYIPITIAAEMLRGFIQYGPNGNPQQKKWGPKEWVAYSADKTGLGGPSRSFAVSAAGDSQRGNLPGTSLLGPAYQQANKVISTLRGHGSVAKTIEDSLPASSLYKHMGDGIGEQYRTSGIKRRNITPADQRGTNRHG